MWEIWENKLLLKPLKNCQKSNKSPHLVTLATNLLRPRRLNKIWLF